jgi:5'-nucleotidase
VKGYRFARLGRRTYGQKVVEKLDPRGRRYYWIGSESSWEDVPNSDCTTVFEEGLASVTPLHLDTTHDAMLSEMRNWTLEGYRKEPAL